jgi:hypothetical protein
MYINTGRQTELKNTFSYSRGLRHFKSIKFTLSAAIPIRKDGNSNFVYKRKKQLDAQLILIFWAFQKFTIIFSKPNEIFMNTFTAMKAYSLISSFVHHRINFI